jgi:hypothetical protein
MKKAILGIIVLCLASLACGSVAPSQKTADDYVNEFGGNADVYARILSMNDCATLQTEFDQAEANSTLQEPGTPQYRWSLGYMKASDDRMKTIGCYDGSSQDVPSPTLDIALVIEGTVNAANSQTALAYSPTAYFTSTFLPTLTAPVIPSPITIPTSLNTAIPTNTVIFILPTQAPAGVVCPCAGDTLNCGDFASSGDAQACMDYCISRGAGDIHNLDGNANGQACEA